MRTPSVNDRLIDRSVELRHMVPAPPPDCEAGGRIGQGEWVSSSRVESISQRCRLFHHRFLTHQPRMIDDRRQTPYTLPMAAFLIECDTLSPVFSRPSVVRGCNLNSFRPDWPIPPATTRTNTGLHGSPVAVFASQGVSVHFASFDSPLRRAGNRVWRCTVSATVLGTRRLP